MAERNSFSRPTTGKSSVKNTNVKASRERDLDSKAEEYRRMNEQLEARTASLFEYVESVKREQDEQDESLGSASLLDKVNMDDYLKDWDTHEDNTVFDPDLESPTVDSSRSSRPASKVSNIGRPPSKNKKSVKSQGKKKPISSRSEPDDTIPDLSLQPTLANIEDKIDQGETLEYVDVMLPGASELNPENQVVFLKAQLRACQKEVEELAALVKEKEEENAVLMTKLKEAEDERNRLSRTNAAQQHQMDKYRKLSDDAKVKADALETQLSATQKELDQLKRAQKKQESSQSATEVRLNRALEEIEKLKSQLHKAKTEGKESSAGEKKKVDQLLAENKRLEKQKSELLTGFKKQLKLIEVLKRQRMHIEAAKMLQFSEEEFVKALEWGN